MKSKGLRLEDDFDVVSLEEFCMRSKMPRAFIEQYLLATQKEHLLQGAQWQIKWIWLIADLPAFRAYLKHNHTGRSEADIAARADAMTVRIWRYVRSREPYRGLDQKPHYGLKQRLKRLVDRLKTLEAKTSPDETGDKVAKIMWDPGDGLVNRRFPYLELESELRAATESIKPQKPPKVSEQIRLVEFIVATLPKTGSRARASLKKAFLEELAVDHRWLTGRSRSSHGAKFSDFVTDLIEGQLQEYCDSELLTGLNAATLIGYDPAKRTGL